LVLDAAKRHQVPAALIVSHSNHRTASQARKEAQAAMIEELGMKRRWVAFMFNRDLRRVRASELGQKVDRKYCKKTSKFRHFREILVPVGLQLVWVEYLNLPTIGRARRIACRPMSREESAEIQLVLGFLSWRNVNPYGKPSQS
jgi:hypothetical protein